MTSPEDLPPGTVLETDEEIRLVQSAIRSQKADTSRGPHLSKNTEKTHSNEADGEVPYRPTSRPPQVFLILYDDGQRTGELVRIRHDRFVIGRSEGDLRLPDDDQISGRHVAISRQAIGGKFRWVISDLQSRNGLFARVGKAPLNHGAEVIIGRGKFRLESLNRGPSETADYGADSFSQAQSTRVIGDDSQIDRDVFSEILSSGLGARYVLNRNQYWIGSSRECEICRSDDPFVKSKHALLQKSAKGTWVITNQQTINGIWLRLPHISVDLGCSCEFQIGEQRFRFVFGTIPSN
jgi:predicted component of type VI protein secretion system